MPYLIGTDEAGYGPNLGPLIVSATVWQVAEPPAEVDLYRRLARTITAKYAAEEKRLVLADSKLLYKSGGDLRALERGLLPAMMLCGRCFPCDWQQIWDYLEADGAGCRHQLPWHAGYCLPLPLHVERREVERLAQRLDRALARQQVRLRAVCSRAVFPEQFNELVEQHGGKGAALSAVTLQLLADVLARLEPEPVLAICDKHGGRNRYQPLLQQVFPDWLVEVHGESRNASIYRWGPADSRVEVRFCTKADDHFLPTALASMACKYLRELSMRAFNDYWLSRVENLRPTAGYPGDARRFKDAIATVQQELSIADRVLWRDR